MKNKKTNSKKIRQRRKKKQKKHKQKEGELEEEIKKIEEEIKEENFFEEPIREISIPAEIKAPVLERIIEKQIPPMQNQFETQPEPEINQRRIDYSPFPKEPAYNFTRTTEDEEKKYETSFIPPVLTKKEVLEKEIKQEFLKPPTESWSNKIDESRLSEIEFVKEETGLPLEEQKKYKKLKI
jgi:hypothetical protein